ncbi:hypothetical protein OCU04_010725 [Sclerotinia nivalis]|uniref:Major facilitator superfamily (MFS) profile domain-containing protein n=1 Tax=Sclerotinia nivalis TaxID=352851 RepID=A0A9X0ACN1_9HELO|nr:hypothetical protein OCU04_010725 [Sclerotinia nivalis]
MWRKLRTLSITSHSTSPQPPATLIHTESYNRLIVIMSLSTPAKPNSISNTSNDETSPLFPTHHPDDPTCSLPSSPSSPSSSTPSPPLTTLILYLMTLHFLIAFCELVLVAPLISLFESSLCQSYYNFPETASGVLQHDIRLELCRIPEVQGPLATIRGWKSFGDTVPVLLVAIPIGNLGDQYGRRKIMALSLIGVGLSLVEIFVVCAFPKIFDLRWVWLSSFFLLCGGGLYSSAALMWAMASSLIPEDKRSYAFYYIFSAFYIAELVGSYLASITIDISPWIACSMAMVSVILGLLLLWIVPFSQSSPQSKSPSPSTSSSSSSTMPYPQPADLTPKPTILTTINYALTQPNVLLCIPVFLVGTLRYTTLNILIQYSSLRFNTKISQGAMFYTETAIINIFLFLLLIPRITAFIQSKYHIKSEKIDRALMRISVCFLLLGSLAIGLAPTSGWIPVGVSIFAAGCAYFCSFIPRTPFSPHLSPFTRSLPNLKLTTPSVSSRVSTLSLISHFIPASSLATLYASIAVLENLGHAINDPSMQYIFAATLRLPSFWHALPFFVAAICYFLAGLSTIFIKIDTDDLKIRDDGGEE